MSGEEQEWVNPPHREHETPTWHLGVNRKPTAREWVEWANRQPHGIEDEH